MDLQNSYIPVNLSDSSSPLRSNNPHISISNFFRNYVKTTNMMTFDAKIEIVNDVIQSLKFSALSCFFGYSHKDVLRYTDQFMRSLFCKSILRLLSDVKIGIKFNNYVTMFDGMIPLS